MQTVRFRHIYKKKELLHVFTNKSAIPSLAQKCTTSLISLIRPKKPF